MQIFMFPGQGAQRRGMGQDLFDQVEEFAKLEKQIDELLGFSPRRTCLDDPDGRLKQTQYTQPCLYLVNALHFYRARAEGSVPDVVIGHSLGEYNALLAAGAFDLLTGLRLVKKRGALMAEMQNGGMAAVIGMTPPRIAAVLQDQGLTRIDIGNFNSPTQTVLSGPPEDLRRATPSLEKAGAQTVMPLPVSGAFHSRYMIAASQAFARFLDDFTFSPLEIPVVANATGRPYPPVDSADSVGRLLVKQIMCPVQWTQSVQYLIDKGASRFREIGPGDTLSRLLKQISPARQA